MDHASVPVIAVPENSISRYPKNIMYMTSFDEKDAVGIGTVFSVFNWEEIELHCLHLNIDDRADDCELQMDRLISKQVIGSFIDKIKTDILDCSHPHDVIEAYIKLKKIDLIAFIPHRRRSWQYLFTQDLTKKDLFQAKVPIMGIH
jgi:hypothetical protein